MSRKNYALAISLIIRKHLKCSLKNQYLSFFDKRAPVSQIFFLTYFRKNVIQYLILTAFHGFLKAVQLKGPVDPGNVPGESVGNRQ